MNSQSAPTTSTTPTKVAELLQTNPELEMALEVVRHTRQSLFLTGKAGSGKTTFLRQIRDEGCKRMAIVAPTGVAAINAGGMTIHSLFQLPFGLHIPGMQRSGQESTRRFTRNKLRLLRSLELLVIDEVSMVRADMLDAIDEVLRTYRETSEPFGGVQLLMIGDLHQLPPVAKPEEWQLLSKHYRSPYFYSSQALQRTNYQAIELKHIYRQSDPAFIELLNKVRDNRVDRAALELLNSRYIPGFEPPADQAFITLTTTNAVASEINATNLAKLPGDVHVFEAKMIGDFPQNAFPNDLKLEFKPGAQVMFIKNDLGGERRYFNGKIGRISRIENGTIYVCCPGDVNEITVLPAEWQNVKYTLNDASKKIDEQILGVFQQIPLKLAWAITIHKSQGLTFERAVIDAQASFASGQVYVALSRCKSFEGIVLRSPLSDTSIKSDIEILRFTEQIKQRYPSATQLYAARIKFEQHLVAELFEFNGVTRLMNQLQSLYVEHQQALSVETVAQLQVLAAGVQRELALVGQNFVPQLAGYFDSGELPSEHEPLLQRLQKAAAYYVSKIAAVLQELEKLPTKTDNQSVNASIDSLMSKLQLALFSKQQCFAVCGEKFSGLFVQRAKVNAELDWARMEQRRLAGNEAGVKVPPGVSHPELYRQISVWRDKLAAERNVGPQAVFPNATLRELVEVLPVELAALKRVYGIGKNRLEWFGTELCELIAKFCAKAGISGLTAAAATANLPPSSSATSHRYKLSETQQMTLDLWRAGLSLDQIASQRSLSKTTIEGHLAEAVALGLTTIEGLISPEDVTEILNLVTAKPTEVLSEIKAHFADKYSYGQIKIALNSRKSAS